MSHPCQYNVNEAQKWTFYNGAYLARDMSFDAEYKPLRPMAQRKLEARVERWREITMQLLQQHQQANMRIKELEAQLREMGVIK